jgi:hypothetical protein
MEKFPKQILISPDGYIPRTGKKIKKIPSGCKPETNDYVFMKGGTNLPTKCYFLKGIK